MKNLEFLKPFDIEKKRAEIIEQFRQKSNNLDYIPLIGDDYMSLIDIFLFELSKFSEKVNHIISQNYLNFSQGEYLDELVALLGLKRFESVNPIATIEITASNPTFLSKDTIFLNSHGQKAKLLQDVKVQDKTIAQIELIDLVENVEFDSIALEKPNIYISDIKILNPFNQKRRVESDEELKKRFLLSLYRFSTAGSKQSYLYHILQNPSITKANVYTKSAGVVKIVFLSLLDEQIAKIKIQDSLEGKIPLTDILQIQEATKVEINIILSITLEDKIFLNESISKIKQNLQSFFNTLQIGQSVHQSKLIDLCFDDNKALKSVELHDQIPPINQDSIYILDDVKVLLND